MHFLQEVIPKKLPPPRDFRSQLSHLETREDFLSDVLEGIKVAPMSVRLTPHMLSVADWSNPLEDPIRRQFIPLKSTLIQDHPALTLDSLHETGDSPVDGLVHRYPEKALFLGTLLDPPKCFCCQPALTFDSNFRVSGILSILHTIVCGWK